MQLTAVCLISRLIFIKCILEENVFQTEPNSANLRYSSRRNFEIFGEYEGSHYQQHNQGSLAKAKISVDFIEFFLEEGCSLYK